MSTPHMAAFSPLRQLLPIQRRQGRQQLERGDLVEPVLPQYLCLHHHGRRERHSPGYA